MLKIKRTYHPDCTTGFITYGDFRAMTLELPDKNNQQCVSCIPFGRYECKKHVSPSHGDCISIKNVVGRTHVLIHAANWTDQLLGCVAVGETLKPSDRGIMVTSSRKTLKKLMAILPDKFLLEIK